MSKSIFLIYFSVSLFFLTPLASSFSIQDLNISISILDYSHRMCGGTINNSGAITHWDGYTIVSFSLGVANLDTKAHTLTQITVTKVGSHAANGSSFEVNESISFAGNLSIILLPNQYGMWNFTCPPCTYRIILQLIVDDVVLDFGVLTSGDSGFNPKWLTSWSDVLHYTISTSSIDDLSSSVWTSSTTTTPFSTPFKSLVLFALIIKVLHRRLLREEGTK